MIFFDLKKRLFYIFYQNPAAVLGWRAVFVILVPGNGIPVGSGKDFFTAGSSVPFIIPYFVCRIQLVSVPVIDIQDQVFLVSMPVICVVI